MVGARLRRVLRAALRDAPAFRPARSAGPTHYNLHLVGTSLRDVRCISFCYPRPRVTLPTCPLNFLIRH